MNHTISISIVFTVSQSHKLKVRRLHVGNRKHKSPRAQCHLTSLLHIFRRHTHRHRGKTPPIHLDLISNRSAGCDRLLRSRGLAAGRLRRDVQPVDLYRSIRCNSPRGGRSHTAPDVHHLSPLGQPGRHGTAGPTHENDGHH